MYYGLNFIDFGVKNKEKQRAYEKLTYKQKAIVIKDHINYIGRVEGTENNGEHSLFGSLQVNDDIKKMKKIDILNYVKDKVSNGADVYKTVLSLKQEEAEKLGFVTRESWENLIRSNIGTIAREYNISQNNMDWVASMHTEEGHIHCHLVFYDNQKVRTSIPFVKYQNIKKEFNKDIFRGELDKIYELQNQSKKEIRNITKSELDNFSLYDKSKMFNNKLSEDEVKDIVESLTNIAIKKDKEYKETGKGSWKMQYQTKELKKDIRNSTLKMVKYSTAIKETIDKFIKSNIEVEKIKNPSLSDKQYNKVISKSKEFMLKKIDNQILQFLKEQNNIKWNLKQAEFKAKQEQSQKEYYRQAIGNDLAKLLSAIFSENYETGQFQNFLVNKTKRLNETKIARKEYYLKNRDKGFIDWEEK